MEKTIIMIEHRLRELFRIADKVMVLNFGPENRRGAAADGHGQRGRKKSLLGYGNGRIDSC